MSKITRNAFCPFTIFFHAGARLAGVRLCRSALTGALAEVDEAHSGRLKSEMDVGPYDVIKLNACQARWRNKYVETKLLVRYILHTISSELLDHSSLLTGFN